MEIALSKFCGPQDIITPITHYDEKTRRTMGFRAPQNYKGIKPLMSGPVEDRLRALYRCFRHFSAPNKYWNHIPARLIREQLGEKVWNNYYKFTIVRNPYDRTISQFYWHLSHWGRDSMDFSKYLRQNCGLLVRNWDIVSDEGEFILDGFVRRECLTVDLQQVERSIGLPESIFDIMNRIQAKSQFRPKCGLKQEELTHDQRQFIAFACAPEFEQFGYTI